MAQTDAGQVAVDAQVKDSVMPSEKTTPKENRLSLIDRVNLALIAMPVAARTAARHMLGLSGPSKYLDLRSEVIVAVVRALVVPQRPPLTSLPFFSSSPADGAHRSGGRSITDTQRLLNRDPGVMGPLWVSKYTAPGAANADERASIRDALADVVKRLHVEEGEGRNGAPFPDISWPNVVPVEAEWIGHRTGARESALLPEYMDEKERYAALMSHITAPQPTTVLYLHGGAMYLLDPATHRPAALALSKRIGGRCYSVRYRLAPQSAFPTQILDALVSYLTLLYPPPGAYHEAVSPAHIVFSGDSAGGNLCLALTRVLLDFQRNDTRVMWHGSRRKVPLPAGVAVNSPWVDVSNSSPSWQPTAESGRAEFDYLPPMILPGGDGLNRPPCEAWPSNPPRRFIYIETDLVTHPLASLFTSDPKGWSGAPPMYVCVGWELLADEVAFMTASRLYNNGNGASAVVFEQYEAMPHCFALVLSRLPGAKRCLNGWAGFIRQAVERPETLRQGATGPGSGSSFTHIKAKTLEETPIDPATMSPYTEEQIREAIRKRLAEPSVRQPVVAKTNAKL
ncbi:hypothetical protein HMPREF1624_03240 [Sporothrix schenckii ATCC 58251]|uniref:Alpha/beta hydrolase fold-3 domain-containing protein n=1 Tax=Sporothrix schenckii (strain ATCC 58251 / de Perez 2211183) TaxID=1391915 RepID=U7PW68_SPOS1|nr:hypothetical protein HMPREF1624_03240 [Sporothrix schenckii ATCC 58251]